MVIVNHGEWVEQLEADDMDRELQIRELRHRARAIEDQERKQRPLGFTERQAVQPYSYESLIIGLPRVPAGPSPAHPADSHEPEAEQQKCPRLRDRGDRPAELDAAVVEVAIRIESQTHVAVDEILV